MENHAEHDIELGKLPLWSKLRSLSFHLTCQKLLVLHPVCSVLRRSLRGYCLVRCAGTFLVQDVWEQRRQSRGSKKCQVKPGAAKMVETYQMDIASHHRRSVRDFFWGVGLRYPNLTVICKNRKTDGKETVTISEGKSRWLQIIPWFDMIDVSQWRASEPNVCCFKPWNQNEDFISTAVLDSIPQSHAA